MNCIKIAMVVTLIIVPLALRGASLLGNAVAAAVVPSSSPEQQQQRRPRPPPGSKNGASPSSSAHGQHWKDQSRHAAFTRRRFGTGAGGFFSDDKRFSPTGSNPLHNL
uniref:Uncharacterized protein n=2 Tax=Oryza TaxID=4527 RepID=A0A0D3G3R9_9ORYZ